MKSNNAEKPRQILINIDRFDNIKPIGDHSKSKGQMESEPINFLYTFCEERELSE